MKRNTMRVLMSMHSACVCWRWQQASTRIKSAQIQLRSTVVSALYVLQVVMNVLMYEYCYYDIWLRGSVGRTSVSTGDLSVLCSAHSWRVTTYVGKPSAIGQPTRPTQLSVLPGLIKWVVTHVKVGYRGKRQNTWWEVWSTAHVTECSWP